MTATTTADLAAALAGGVGQLGRFGAAYPVHLEAPEGHEVVPAAELFEGQTLTSYFLRAIAEWSARPEDENIQAAASRFMRRYCGSLATAALVPLAHGVAIDVSLPHVSVLIRDELPMGVVLRLADTELATSQDRPTSWPVSGSGSGSAVRGLATASELREQALRSLFGGNFLPAFARVRRAARLQTTVLWATAAEQIDLLCDTAADTPGVPPSVARAYADDRQAVLFAPTVPGVDAANPMLGALDWEQVDDPLFPRPLQVRKVCCVNYLIPGRGRYCRTCDRITPEDRLTLWRAWQAMDGQGARPSTTGAET